MTRPIVALCGLNARFSHTNLALRCLAAQVRQNWPQGPQLILTEWTINDPQLDIVRQLYRMNAAVYAFSCYIWNIGLIRALCRQLRKIRPHAWIIWGGPEVSFDAANRLAGEPAVNLISRGEGEISFLNLLHRLFPGPDSVPAYWLTPADRPDLGDVPGLTWRELNSGIIHENPDAPLLEPDEWPFPYDPADLAGLNGRIVYYETARGCPFRCAYCLSALDRMVRQRPLPQVYGELDCLIAAGLLQIKLVDRTFNCQPGRARRIWQYLLERREAAGRTNFHFEVAGDLLDDPTVELLNQAPPGLFQLEIGVQTIQPDVLRTISRPTNLAALQRQVRKLRQAGRVHLHLDLIAGLPGEDLESFSQSLDWVWDLQPQQLQLGFLKILPGSPMRQLAAERLFLWQDDPPYEVLQSDKMSFADLDRLKMVAQIIELFHNSGIFSLALPWLAGLWPRPWLFLAGLAAWTAAQGCLDRAVGPEERCRLLWRFGREHVPELAADSWLAMAWRDLLKLDYLLSGHKDQPAWLDFWENSADPAAGSRLRQVRRAFRARRPDCGRLRIERFCFDWNRLHDGGGLQPGSWLAAFDLSGSPPLVLEDWPENG
jgi:radical SAM superfamily enzyme YgiQ (UPF0313 family)